MQQNASSFLFWVVEVGHRIDEETFQAKEEALGQKLEKDKLFSSDDSKISDDPLV